MWSKPFNKQKILKLNKRNITTKQSNNLTFSIKLYRLLIRKCTSLKNSRRVKTFNVLAQDRLRERIYSLLDLKIREKESWMSFKASKLKNKWAFSSQSQWGSWIKLVWSKGKRPLKESFVKHFVDVILNLIKSKSALVVLRH